MVLQVQWVGQPIALVVAESRAIADRAAGLVKVIAALPLLTCPCNAISVRCL